MNKKLDEYMKENDLTDQQFGDKIGVGRMQVLRYRKKKQIPGKKRMQKIVKVTKGAVTPASFYE